MRIGIFYGTTSGATRRIARRMAAELEPLVWQLQNVEDATVDDLRSVDLLICGASNWGYGQLPKNWERMLSQLTGACLASKPCAVFGLGDSFTHSWSFVNSLRVLWDGLRDAGCSMIGAWPTSGYSFGESRALLDDSHFVGLALDEDSEPLETDCRIYAWLAQVWNEFHQPAARHQRRGA